MDLKDFISEILFQISSGVKDGADRCIEIESYVNPKRIEDDKKELQSQHSITGEPQTIKMEIALVVNNAKEKGAKGSIGVAAFGFGANGGTSTSQSSSSKIEFEIPICFPITKV